jgi:hypothetical protein
MRTEYLILGLLICSILMSACAKQDRQLDHATKGWELRSWLEEDTWHYSLLVGTNRMKTCEEIASTESAKPSVSALKEELARLRAGEEVYWTQAGSTPSGCRDFTYPPEDVVGDLSAYCDDMGIGLHIYRD